MRTAVSVLLVVAASSAVHVGYVAPVASGYIYRSDNNGPASLIQLGAVPYQQPHAFAPPLPIAQPPKLEAFEAYDLAPAPLPYIAAEPIVEVDAGAEDEDDDDDDDDSSEEYLDHGHGYEKKGGNDYGAEHHEVHGEKGSKGYSSKDHHADGESGHYGKEHNEGFYKESEGKVNHHHDDADAHGKHHEAGGSYKGGNHGHKKHHSKGEEVTGYHKVFHKDEFKKDHDFYDVADNSGHFKKYGHEHEKHGSQEGAEKEGGHHDSAFKKGEFGKAGHHAKGHSDESDDGVSSEEGHESHYSQEEDYGKKGGSSQEKEYEYEDDDDED
ncbi:sarcoplasmic reticulum histidine-rich calcium-binding protein-like [Pectinophora gossypiella]|nr:sarcoplasmic reticulum histidine-rich calcium-binding protein-like [Pectinophora gossypiella]XP_049885699.1 sarcoplasmic reticulum histidine-rich calcium-binding protein-like [Pectinophora gossypiella]